MVDTAEQAIKPLYLVICFLGFGIFRHNLDHTRPCLSTFYILTVWSIYAYAFYYMVDFFSPHRIFTGFLLFFVIMTNLFVTIISVIINIREHKKMNMCIKNLSLVDDTLEQLGTPKEYYKMRNSLKWILALWFMMICITWVSDSFVYIERLQDMRTIIIPVILNYPFHVNTFMDIVFMFLLRSIDIRFDKINGYMEQLSETKEYGLRCTWKKSLVTRYYVQKAENRQHVLWTLMHLHLKLCSIARTINGFFGIQMTLQMISYFVFIISVFYYEYHTVLCLTNIQNNSKTKVIFLIPVNIWCSVYLTKFITLNYICENISTKAKKTKYIIHKLTNLVYFVQTHEDICQFILQISLRPLKLNGIGLSSFGYKFILKFTVAVISVLIFMMQMENSPLSRILITRKNNETCFE